ncbi:hypothetical protein PGT21_023173 [Puccinia graminis f. sp. tritici]|uniref:Uncharacterized protein n=1 Tax=Puccinia graminis f. sp. tritici TaxID=56615 RepID=A0A5B0PUW6_PUCGR|nr:hypothetical protein PGT21_023173 [Puccinia graminis f. sp. tritici]
MFGSDTCSLSGGIAETGACSPSLATTKRDHLPGCLEVYEGGTGVATLTTGAITYFNKPDSSKIDEIFGPPRSYVPEWKLYRDDLMECLLETPKDDFEAPTRVVRHRHKEVPPPLSTY